MILVVRTSKAHLGNRRAKLLDGSSQQCLLALVHLADGKDLFDTRFLLFSVTIRDRAAHVQAPSIQSKAKNTYAEPNVDGEVVQVVNLLLDLLATSLGREVDVGLDGTDRLAAVSSLEDKLGKLGTSYRLALLA